MVFQHQVIVANLSAKRFGFRVKRSTEPAVTLLCDDFRKNANSKLLTGCVFTDFSKAFDTISHAKLLQKLNAYGIRSVEFEWFSDYLFNRKQSSIITPCPNLP